MIWLEIAPRLSMLYKAPLYIADNLCCVELSRSHPAPLPAMMPGGGPGSKGDSGCLSGLPRPGPTPVSTHRGRRSLGVRVSYHPDYVIPLPERHSFPMTKFGHLHVLLLDEGVIAPSDVVEPEEHAWDELARVHTLDYLAALENGTMSEQAMKRMGFPWTEALVRRSRLAVNGTVNAAEMALDDGIAANLAGGTHHAFPGHGEGFCVLNDVAVAIRTLRHAGRIERALVLDLDVHQGNGTAAIFEDDDSAYTCSVHGARNFPIRKERSTLDVPLPDKTADEAYMTAMRETVPRVLEEARADIVFYLGGVDVLADDKFGRFAMTMDGLIERERYVTRALRDHGVPVCLLLSGGYAPTHEETARRHSVMIREASRVF